MDPWRPTSAAEGDTVLGVFVLFEGLEGELKLTVDGLG